VAYRRRLPSVQNPATLVLTLKVVMYQPLAEAAVELVFSRVAECGTLIEL